MPPRIPDEQRATIADAIRAGGTARGIARDHGVASSTVIGIAKEFGIANAFDRTQTKHACEARRADNALRRATLATAMLDDAHKMRAQLWEPCRVHHWTKEGTFVDAELERPTFADQRNIAVAAKVLADGALNLERNSTGEADEARSMIERLVDGLHAQAAAEPPPDPGPVSPVREVA